MDQYKDIALWLSAAAANARPGQQGNNLIFQEGSTLYMEQWTNDGLSGKTPIVEGVRDETPVALIVDNKIFVLNANSVLTCHVKPQGDGKPGELWPEENLGDGNIQIHPDSQLFALQSGGQVIIFYQDTDGDLSSIKESNGIWTVSKLLATSPTLGTPLGYFPHLGKEHLLYVTEDDLVRALVKEEGEEEWKDQTFSPARLQGSVSNLVAIPTQEDDEPEGLSVFGLVSSQLVMINGTTEDAVVLGMVKNRTYLGT
ncbi:uncharacterized protein Triagg1_594 [Trichoderma aggressivum f. europaeum]|uniref:Fucose-specific lectin n=1 Tax=Trichoderma aggressivum f. europaeum TaxID=173218 RepID=A0AAE1INL7_9HYPO|nr:hypothetical protein Triagg1_594 [Trichoderma aggressivum f. europaeum]